MSQTFGSGSVVRLPSGRWTLAPGSSASFVVSNFGFKKVRGTVPILEAEATVEDSGRISSVHAVLALSAIDTGNARRDADLAKPKLLDTQQFPTMTFEGGRSDSGPSGQRVSGTLTARGRAVPLDLTVSIEQRDDAGLSVSANTAFDRADLGVKAPSFMIGRQIDVDIRAVFQPG